MWAPEQATRVTRAPNQPDRVGVFEVWENREAHRASLQLENVRRLIEKAMPLIAGPLESVEVVPVAGYGLPQP